MRHILTACLMTVLLAAPSWAGEEKALKDRKSMESYSLGYEFGNNLKRHGVEIDLNILLGAIREGIEGNPPALSPETIRNTIVEQKRRLTALQGARAREYAAKNLEDSRTFLEQNKVKEGVKTLPSGLQYRVLQEGNGPVPKITDHVRVAYRGTLIDGKEFDSSLSKGPVTLPVKGMVKGWSEALQLMKTGSKWQLFVPPELGYGKRQFPRIPPNSTLIYEIELLSIGGEAEDTAESPKNSE